MKTILALSFGFHDSSIAIGRGGKLIAFEMEERLSWQKHDAGFPGLAFKACMERAKLSPQEIDEVYLCENPYSLFSRILFSTFQSWPWGFKDYVDAMLSWLPNKLWIPSKVSKAIGVPLEKIKWERHHHSHMMSAFCGSGFEEADILVCDAVGEWDATTWGSGRIQDDEYLFNHQVVNEFPHSLGLFYSAMTQYLGFKPNSSECTTMALSSFGKPRFTGELWEMVNGENDKLHLSQKFWNFTSPSRNPWTKEFEQVLGKGRRDEELRFSSFEDSFESNRWSDIAKSTQVVLEQRVLKLLEEKRTQSKRQNLCLAGGVMKNCVLVQKILESNLWQNIYIPPDPGDGGLSAGVALAKSGRPGPLESIYSGEKIDSEKLSFVSHLKKKDFEVREFESSEKLIEKSAQALAQGKVLAWVQGQSERGPRALGNRSLLFRSDSLSLAEKVSGKFKLRAAYRPYALSLMDEEVERILDIERIQNPHYWMQTSCLVKPEVKDQVRGGTHVDGTTRPQVVRFEDNPTYYKLLKAYKRETGLGALVNTSLNESGRPLVSSELDAFTFFSRVPIDILVVDNLWFERGQ